MEPSKEHRFGWFSFTPHCLQWLNRSVWFLIFMCYGNMFQSMLVNGLMGVALSTLEKRFDLSSSQSSFIVSAYEIATIPTLIVVSYVGAKGHRPRWIAVTLLILGLAGFLFAVPHFTTPVYDPREADRGDNNLCRERSNETQCKTDQGESSLAAYLWLFIVARLLMGVGATPLYTMGVTYMDDIVTRDSFSLYVALFYGFGVLGPAIGLIGGGYLLNVFTDFPSLNPESYGIRVDDPRWIGAWWLGFMIAGGALVFVVIPFSGYARDIPGAAEIRDNKKTEAYGNTDEDAPTDGDFGNFKDLPKSFKLLVTNPTFMFLCGFSITDGIIISGFTSYGPKYVENQFSISSGFAGMMFGLITIPGGVGGTIFGGAIVKCLKLTCRGIMKVSAICNLIIILLAFLFFITCENTRFAGVNVGYNSSSVNGLNATCNSACSCEDVSYDPICAVDNVRYYSPCHAGCTNVTINTDGVKHFRDCKCINGVDSSSGVMATSQTCSVASCKLLPLWMAFFFVVMFLTFSCSSLNISATVRSVPNAQKSIAIGMQWIVLRILGTVPGPPLFGATIDGSCILWQQRCGKTGSCLFYSNEKMALYIFLLAFSVKLVSLVFIVLAWRLYKSPVNDNIISEKEVNIPPVKEKGSDVTNGKSSIPLQYVESVEYKNGFNMKQPLHATPPQVKNTENHGHTNRVCDISTDL